MTIKMELPLTLSSGVNGQLALIVRRQRPLDSMWDLRKGGFWSHRSDVRNEDESKILEIEDAGQGPCRGGGEGHSSGHPATT